MNKKKVVFIILPAVIILITLSCTMMNMTNSFSEFVWYPKHSVMLIFPFLFLAMALVVKYCKKTLKIVLSSIIILVTLFCVMLYIDIDRVSTDKKPIFVWEANNRSGVTANEVTYQGLAYRVNENIEYFEDGRIKSESISMYLFGKKITGNSTEHVYTDWK